MSEKNKQEQESIIKSLAQELDMTEDQIQELLEKSEEEEEEKDETTEEEEEKEKSEIDDLKKSTIDNIKKLKELTKSEEKVEKTEDTLEKAQLDFNDKIEKAMSDVKDSFSKSFETLFEKLEDLSKSVNTIGETSQGTKGLRYNSFLQKAGDSTPISKDGKTFLSSNDRNGISEAMVEVIEKATDEGLKKSMTTDLINYQGSRELSERAVKSLNKYNYFFKEQMTQE